jgi:hypothetical protein
MSSANLDDPGRMDLNRRLTLDRKSPGENSMTFKNLLYKWDESGNIQRKGR